MFRLVREFDDYPDSCGVKMISETLDGLCECSSEEKGQDSDQYHQSERGG